MPAFEVDGMWATVIHDHDYNYKTILTNVIE